MALPVLAVPRYEIKIPSTNEMVSYRPYLVKEEKILLLALESEDEAQITSAVTNIIQACTGINTDMLTRFDSDFLFLNIRSKSVGETTDITIKCANEDCDEERPYKVNFENAYVEGVKSLDELRFDLGNELVIDLNYPTQKEIDKILALKDADDYIVPLIAASLETIYYKDEIFSGNDSTLEEKIEFLGNFNVPQFAPLIMSLENMPEVVYKDTWTCRKCEHVNEINFRGTKDLFI